MLRSPAILFFVFISALSACSKKTDPPDNNDDEPVHPLQSSSSPFISKIIEYKPAPGQLINESLGNPEGAESLAGTAGSLLTLGGFGGNVIFSFDHSIMNQAGADLAIYGNPYPAPTNWSEPGIVMVSRDANRNDLADDEWYELQGSQHNKAGTIHNYRITYYNPGGYASVSWRDNQGNTGTIDTNTFHVHNYYPEFIPEKDSVSFQGTLLENTFELLSGTGIYINDSFEKGYADSWSAGDDYATNLYNSFDIDDAVDIDLNPVTLKSIDFVKVYTAQNCKGNALIGEISTEIAGAKDLNMK